MYMCMYMREEGKLDSCHPKALEWWCDKVPTAHMEQYKPHTDLYKLQMECQRLTNTLSEWDVYTCTCMTTMYNVYTCIYLWGKRPQSKILLLSIKRILQTSLALSYTEHTCYIMYRYRCTCAIECMLCVQVSYHSHNVDWLAEAISMNEQLYSNKQWLLQTISTISEDKFPLKGVSWTLLSPQDNLPEIKCINW